MRCLPPLPFAALTVLLVASSILDASAVDHAFRGHGHPMAAQYHHHQTPRSVQPVRNAVAGLLDHSQRIAKRRIPYRFGGTGPTGMDCSASVQHLFQVMGVRLPRNSEAQANYLAKTARLWRAAPGETESIIAKRLRPGDLLFWSKPGQANKIGHVMMFVGIEPDGYLRLWGARGTGKTGLSGSGVDFHRYRIGSRRKSQLVAYGRPALH